MPHYLRIELLNSITLRMRVERLLPLGILVNFHLEFHLVFNVFNQLISMWNPTKRLLYHIFFSIIQNLCVNCWSERATVCWSFFRTKKDVLLISVCHVLDNKWSNAQWYGLTSAKIAFMHQLHDLGVFCESIRIGWF